MMSYSNKFVMCVMVDGQPVKSLANGETRIPFNSEYVLRFKNKHNRRAVVKFFIDGENVSGAGYVISGNSHVDIKRHASHDAAFKLVPLDSWQAVDAGKSGSNEDKQKGVIEARFYLEKEKKHEVHHHHYHKTIIKRGMPWTPPYQPYTPYWQDLTHGPFTPIGGSNVTYGSSSTGGSNVTYGASMNCSSFGGDSLHPVLNQLAPESSFVPESKVEDGCTVEGNMTGQLFETTYIDCEDNYTTLTLFLRGYHIENVIPVNNICQKGRRKNVEDDLFQENEKLRKEIAEQKRIKERDALLEENRRLREELEALKS